MTIESPKVRIIERRSRRDDLDIAKSKEPEILPNKRKLLTKSETVSGEPSLSSTTATSGVNVKNPCMNRSFDQPQTQSQSPQSKSIPQQRRDLSLTSASTTRNAKLRSQGAQSLDSKSTDRMSTSSRRSVIIKLREKFFGRKSKSNRFDENLIQTSLKVVDTRSTNKYTLDDAVKMGLIFGDNRIKDTLNNTDYSVDEAVAKGLLKFYHPINSFEFKYGLSCFIFNGEWLLLVNYVLDPLNRRKIGLKNAFVNLIVDKENNVFYTKKGSFFNFF